MPPERILIATDEMEVGGSQRQIVHLLSGLDRERWAPELAFFRNPSRLVDEVAAMGIPVHHVPKRGRLDAGFVRAYSRLLGDGGFGLVHAFSLTAELWTLLARLPLRHRPALVSSVRGLYLDRPRSFWRLKRFVLRHSAATIANAHACAEAAARNAGVDPATIDVVPNGIAFPEPLARHDRVLFRHATVCPPGRTFGLFVGRQVGDKNLPCLLRALARLDADERPWIALAGDGPLRGELQAQVRESGLAGDVSFLGERGDATRLMQAADFLVLPSRQEGMSNALLEAMAAGCPVIASAVGGSLELVEHGRNGLLFDNDDDAALARCLARLTSDPALRTALSRAALSRAEDRHSIRGMVERTSAVYLRCLHPARETGLARDEAASREQRAIHVVQADEGSPRRAVR